MLLLLRLCTSHKYSVIQKYPSRITQALPWLNFLEGGPTAVVQAAIFSFGLIWKARTLSLDHSLAVAIYK